MVSPKAKKVIKTSVVMFIMMNVGVNVGLFSPTLPDIELLTSSSTSQVSMTLIWAGIASVGGTLAIGPLFDRLNGFLLLTICLTMQAIAISLAPLWPSLVAYQALSAIAFIFNFALMSVNCALWKSSPALLIPVIQVTDLMHAVGAAITPQVVRPFIGIVNQSAINSTPGDGSTTGGLLPVQIAYVIIGAFDMATAALCLSIYCWSHGCCCPRRRRRRHMATDVGEICRRDSSDDDDELQLLTDGSSVGHGSSSALSTVKLNPRTRPAIVLLSIMSLFFVTNGGREALLTGLLFTYVNQYLGWTVAAGTALVSVYHLTRVVVHAALVPVSRWVSPTRLTIVNLIVLAAGAVLTMVSLAGDSTLQKALLSFGVVVIGTGTSNVNPTAITVVEETIHVSAPVMALLVSSVGAGQIVLAPLTGWLLQHSGVHSFASILFGLTVVGSGFFAVWIVMQRRATSVGARRSAESAVPDASSSCCCSDGGSSVTTSTMPGNNETRRRSSKYEFDNDDDNNDNNVYERRFNSTNFHVMSSIDDDF